MKNFNWTTFTKRIAVKSTLPEIYNAWTKAADIEKWFLSKAKYFDSNNSLVDKNVSAEKGFTYEWNWYLYDATEKGIITDANGKDFIQFTFEKSLVDIKLVTQDNYTIVELTQKNIPADDDSKQNIRLGCESGWSFFLVNLKSVYEGGHDLRNKNPEHKGMVNN